MTTLGVCAKNTKINGGDTPTTNPGDNSGDNTSDVLNLRTLYVMIAALAYLF